MFAQMFNSTAELIIPTAIEANEANAEIETQPLTVQDTIIKFSTKFKYLHVFLYFSLIKSLCFILSKR